MSTRNVLTFIRDVIAEPGFVVRLVALLIFYGAVQVWTGFLATLLAATLFLLWMRWDVANACQAKEDDIRKSMKIPLKVAAFATGDPDDLYQSQAVVRLDAIRRKTHCLFAARAVLWGNDWEEEESGDALALNIARCLPRFYRFCLEVHAGESLDGFVFELRGARYGADVASFADAVRRLLTGLSDADPAQVHCMRKSNIGRRGWYFQFAREPLFITSFAPCYPDSHPRYQFGVHPDSCFVLFQPEESFLRHDLPSDKPRSQTNWDNPKDIRDKIRANFLRNGREYLIPETTSYPTANFIVPPMCPLRDPPVEFWRLEGKACE